MAPDLLSNADFVRLTSRVVAACCKAIPVDPRQLPALIASVDEALRTQMGVLAEEPVTLPIFTLNSTSQRGLDRPQHTLRMAPIQIGRPEVSQAHQEPSCPSAANVVNLDALSNPTQTRCSE